MLYKINQDNINTSSNCIVTTPMIIDCNYTLVYTLQKEERTDIVKDISSFPFIIKLKR